MCVCTSMLVHIPACACVCACVSTVFIQANLTYKQLFYYIIFFINYHNFNSYPCHMDSLNSFQRTSQRSHFPSVCWSPISKNSPVYFNVYLHVTP